MIRVVGSFLWACIIGTLCAGAVVSGLIFLDLIGEMLKGVR